MNAPEHQLEGKNEILNKARIEQICPLVYFLIKQPLFKWPNTYGITSQWGSFLLKWVTNQGGHASWKSMQGPPCLVTVGGRLMRMLEGASSPFSRSSRSFRVAHLAPWSPAGLISAPGRGSPCIGIVSSCWRDAFFITSFIFQTLLFYELQSHALPLWGAVINYSKSGTRANLSSDQENVKLGS